MILEVFSFSEAFKIKKTNYLDCAKYFIDKCDIKSDSKSCLMSYTIKQFLFYLHINNTSNQNTCLPAETINVPVLGFAHLIVLVFQLITLLRKVLLQVVQICLQAQFSVFGCIFESTQFLIVLRVALALLHRTLLRSLPFSHD